MAAAKTDESPEQCACTVRKTRYVAASAAESTSASSSSEPREEAPGALMSRRAAIGGMCMGAAALLCIVVGTGLVGTGSAGGEAAVSDAPAQEVFDLQERIKTAQRKAEGLPGALDAERGLVTAQSSAEQIAQLQNDYRHLTPSVAAAGGEFDVAASEATWEATRRNLTPYFSPEVEPSDLGPWYLLAGDKDVPAGNGIPMSFDSGFEWVARRPYSIEEDSTIRVTWLAVETRPAGGPEPAVLAWARADFDMTRRTFSEVETCTTTTSEAVRQEVKTP